LGESVENGPGVNLMPLPRIYADFHYLDDFNRLRLTCAGTFADLAREQIQLQEGLALMFYMDDADDQGQADEMLVEGTVHFDPEEQVWVAKVDWATVHHASDDKLPGSPTFDSKNGTCQQDVKATKP
jgi:hypothetical protein